MVNSAASQIAMLLTVFIVGFAVATAALLPPDNTKCGGTIRIPGLGDFDKEKLVYTREQSSTQLSAFDGGKYDEVHVSLCNKIECNCNHANCTNIPNSYVILCPAHGDHAEGFELSGSTTVVEPASVPPQIRMRFGTSRHGIGDYVVNIKCAPGAARDPSSVHNFVPSSATRSSLFVGMICPATKTATATSSPSDTVSPSTTRSIAPTESRTMSLGKSRSLSESHQATTSHTHTPTNSLSSSDSQAKTRSATLSRSVSQSKNTRSDSTSSSQTSSIAASTSVSITPPPTPTPSSSASDSSSATITPPPTTTPSISLSQSLSLSTTMSPSASRTDSASITETLPVTATQTVSATVPLSGTNSLTASYSASETIKAAKKLNVSALIGNHSKGVLSTAVPLPATWELQCFDDGNGNLILTSLFPVEGSVPVDVFRPVIAAMTLIPRSIPGSGAQKRTEVVVVAVVFMPTTNTSHVLCAPVDTLTAPTGASQIHTTSLEILPGGFFEDYSIYHHTTNTVIIVGGNGIYFFDSSMYRVLSSSSQSQQIPPSSPIASSASVGGFAKTVSKFLSYNTSSLLMYSLLGQQLCYMEIPKQEALIISQLNHTCTNIGISNTDVITSMSFSNHTATKFNPYDNRYEAIEDVLVAAVIQTELGAVNFIFINGPDQIAIPPVSTPYFAWPLTRPAILMHELDSKWAGGTGGLNQLGVRIVGVHDTVMSAPNFIEDYKDNFIPRTTLKESAGYPVTVGPVIAPSSNSSVFVACGSILFQLDSRLNIVTAINIGREVKDVVVVETYPAGPGAAEPQLFFLVLAPNLLLSGFLLPRAGRESKEARELVWGDVLRLPGSNEALLEAVYVSNLKCFVSIGKAQGFSGPTLVEGKSVLASSTSSTFHLCYNENYQIVEVKTIAASTSDYDPTVQIHGSPLQLLVPTRVRGDIMVSTTAHSLRVSALGVALSVALSENSTVQWTATERVSPSVASTSSMLHPIASRGGNVKSALASFATAPGVQNETLLALYSPLRGLQLHRQAKPIASLHLGQSCIQTTSPKMLSSDRFLEKNLNIAYFFCLAPAPEGFVKKNVLWLYLFDMATMRLTGNQSWSKWGSNTHDSVGKIVSNVAVGSPDQQGGDYDDDLDSASFRIIAAMDSSANIVVFDCAMMEGEKEDSSRFSLTASLLNGAPTKTRDVQLANDGNFVFLLSDYDVQCFRIFPTVSLEWQSRRSTFSAKDACNPSAPYQYCGLRIEDKLCQFGGPCSLLMFNNNELQLVGFSSLHSKSSASTFNENVLWELGSDAHQYMSKIAAPIVTWKSRIYLFSASNWSINCYHHLKTSATPLFLWSAPVLDSTLNPNAPADAPWGRSGAGVDAHIRVNSLGVVIMVLRMESETLPRPFTYSLALGVDALSGKEKWRVVPSTTAVTAYDARLNPTTQRHLPVRLFAQSESFIPDPKRASALWNENLFVAQLAANPTAPNLGSSENATLLERRTVVGINVLTGKILFQLPLYTRRNGSSSSTAATRRPKIEPLLLHIVSDVFASSSASSPAAKPLQLIISGGYCYDVDPNVVDAQADGRIVQNASPTVPIATCLWSFDLSLFPTGPTAIVPAVYTWMDTLYTSVQLFQLFGTLYSTPPSWTPSNLGEWEGLTLYPAANENTIVSASIPGFGIHGVLNWTAFPCGRHSSGPPNDTTASTNQVFSMVNFNVSNNAIFGAFDPSFVSCAQHLETLDISDNWFQGSINSFENLPGSLANLRLGGNMLKSASENLFATSKSRSLQRIRQLSNLRLFDLQNTMLGMHGIANDFLSFLPQSIEMLLFRNVGFQCPLFSFQVNGSYSSFVSGHDRLYFLPNLVEMDVSHNMLTGGMELHEMRCENLPLNLAKFDLSFNHFQGLMPQLFRRNESLVQEQEQLLLSASQFLVSSAFPESTISSVGSVCKLKQLNASFNAFLGRLDLNHTLLSMEVIDFRRNLLSGDVNILWIQEQMSDSNVFYFQRKFSELSTALGLLTPAPVQSGSDSFTNLNNNTANMSLSLLLSDNPGLLTVVSQVCPLPASTELLVTLDRQQDCTNLTGSTGNQFFVVNRPFCAPNSTLIWYPAQDSEDILIMNPGLGSDHMNCSFPLRDLIRNPLSNNIALLGKFVDNVRWCLPLGILISRADVTTNRVTGFADEVVIYYYPNTDEPTAPAEMAIDPDATGLTTLTLRYDNCNLMANEIERGQVCTVSSYSFYNLTIGADSAILSYQDRSGLLNDCHFNGTILLLPKPTPSGDIYPAKALLAAIQNCLPLGSPYVEFTRMEFGKSKNLLLYDQNDNPLQFYPSLCSTRQKLPPCKLLPQVPYTLKENEDDSVCVFGMCSHSRTFLWKPCGQTIWDYEGFESLNKCIPMNKIIRLLPDTTALTASDPCSMESSGGSQQKQGSCSQEAGRWVANAWETIMVQNGNPQFGSSNYKAYCETTGNTPCINANSTLVKNQTTQDVFCNLIRFFESGRNASIRARCLGKGSGVLLSTCEDNIPLAIYNRSQCNKGLEIECSSCLPYIEPSATALPYAFLIISSVKDIFFILMGAYFLSKPWFRRPVTGFLVKVASTLTPFNPREKDKFKYQIFRILNPREVKLGELVSISEDILGFASVEEMEDGDEASGWEVITGTKVNTKKKRRIRRDAMNARSSMRLTQRSSMMESAASISAGPGSLHSNEAFSPPFPSNTPPLNNASFLQQNTTAEGEGPSHSLQTSTAPTATTLQPQSQASLYPESIATTATTTATNLLNQSEASFFAAVRSAPPQLQEDFLVYYQSKICERQKRMIRNFKDPAVREKFQVVYQRFALIWKAQQDTEEGRAFLHSKEFLGVKPEDLHQEVPSTPAKVEEAGRNNIEDGVTMRRQHPNSHSPEEAKSESANPKSSVRFYLEPAHPMEEEEPHAGMRVEHNHDQQEGCEDEEEMKTVEAIQSLNNDNEEEKGNEATEETKAKREEERGSSTPPPPPRLPMKETKTTRRAEERSESSPSSPQEQETGARTPPPPCALAAQEHHHQKVHTRQRGKSVLETFKTGLSHFVESTSEMMPSSRHGSRHTSVMQEGGGESNKELEEELLPGKKDANKTNKNKKGVSDGEHDDEEMDAWDEIGGEDLYEKDPERRLDDQKALLAYALRELHDVCEMEPIILREEVLDSRFTPQPWMLLFEFCYATVYFLVCVVQTTRVPGYSAWDLYQSVFFRYINSAVSVGLLVNSFLRRVYLDEPTIALDFYVVSSGVLILPVFFTHIIPGLILYCWIPIAVLLIWVPACFVMREFEKQYFYTMDPISISFRVVFRLGMTAVVTLMLQSSFNWAVLYYTKEALHLDYLGVLEYEYNSRLWGCFIESRLSSLANTVQFISAFA